MSSANAAMRRLGLLASSSLLAASLSAAAFTSMALAPTVARADNECTPVGVDPSANGSASDSYTCSDEIYPTGITYDSDGDLTVTTTTGTQVQVEGANLDGNGADNVTWDSSAGYVSGSYGATATVGPTIDVTSESGDIEITTTDVSASDLGTHAIRATSTGGGDITITSNGNLNAQGEASTAIVEATTNGGDINITAATGSGFFNGHSGRLRGIIAQTSGDGDISVSVTGSLNTTSADGPLIETTAGDGDTTITLTSGFFGSNEFFGAPVLTYPERVNIRGSSTSSSPTAVTVLNSGAMMFGAVDFSGVVSGGVTLTTTGAGIWRAAGDSVFGGGDDTINFGGSLPNVTGNALAEGGSFDFGSGNDTINITSSFEVGTAKHFGSELGAAAGLGATLAFGSGTDTINNSGVFGIEGPVVITGLESFNNSGVLSLGPISPTTIDPSIGDLGTDDRLWMPGTTFTGTGLSRIVAAVRFDTSEQVGCETLTGAGDCLYLGGGTTAGSTLVTLLNGGEAAALSAFNPVGVTIIDVAGGTSAAEHFAIDPNSQGYFVDPTYGGVIGRPGLFVYALRYDPANQRHAVVGLPRSEALEYAMLGSAAQSIWYMTSQAVTDRQTDLRAGTQGSVWLKASGEYGKRDVVNRVDVFGDSFAMDQSYKLYAGTLMGGMDFISGHSGGYDYVVGAQIGYVGSTFDLNSSPSSGQFTGATGGIYSSIWDGALFVDGTFNTNFLTLDYDAPGLGSKTTTWLRSVGAELEGGRRFMLSDKLFAEPLATLAFMYTTFEEVSLAGGEVRPADTSSKRGALGLRLGADMFGGPLKVRYFVVGRAWQEFDAENVGVVNNPGQPLLFGDDASGGFGEAQAGLSLLNDDQTLAGFLRSGVKWNDDFSTVDLDLGLRLRW